MRACRSLGLGALCLVLGCDLFGSADRNLSHDQLSDGAMPDGGTGPGDGGTAPRGDVITLAWSGTAGMKADSTYLYFLVSYSGIFKVPLVGGEPVTLVSLPLGGPNAIAGTLGLAIDESSMYFISSYNSPEGLQKGPCPFRAPLAGGDATRLDCDSTFKTPTAMTADQTHIFWLAYSGPDNGVVLRMAKDGGPVETIAGGQSIPIAVAVDETDVFWVNNVGGQVMKAPKAGGEAVVLANEGQDEPNSIAVDATYVYWTTGLGQTLRKVPKAGDTPVTLRTDLGSAGSVAVDATHLYWATWDGLWRMPLAGGDVERLFDQAAGGVTLDPTGVCFSYDLRIARVPK